VSVCRSVCLSGCEQTDRRVQSKPSPPFPLLPSSMYTHTHTHIHRWLRAEAPAEGASSGDGSAVTYECIGECAHGEERERKRGGHRGRMRGREGERDGRIGNRLSRPIINQTNQSTDLASLHTRACVHRDHRRGRTLGALPPGNAPRRDGGGAAGRVCGGVAGQDDPGL
jgi:hypothetical protein